MKYFFLLSIGLYSSGALAASNPMLNFGDLVMPDITAIHDAPLRQPSFDDMRNPLARPHVVDVTEYRLDIAVDPFTSRIDGEVAISFHALRDGLREITVDAVEMEIRRVVDAAGNSLSFLYDREFLTISLSAALADGEEGQVIISYTARQPQSLRVTGPDVTHPRRMLAAYTYTQPLGSRSWFPCIDRPDDKALSDVTVTVSDHFKVLSNGAMIESEQYADTASWRYRMDQPIAPYLISLAIGDYEVFNLGTHAGKQLTLWTPPGTELRAMGEVARTEKMMQSFHDFTGVDYPFASYAQSVAEAWGSSMEHQSATTMGGMRMTGDGSGEWVVAHELAHQWFGDHVTCSTWEDLWLNEGFATYLPFVFVTDQGEGEVATWMLDRWRDGYFEEALTMVRPLSPNHIDPEAIFDSHSYEKGALVIHMMRQRLNAMVGQQAGEPEPFTRALREYLSEHGGGNVRNFDLQRAMESVSGRSWQLFFDQWVRSAGHPVLKAEVATPKGGGLILDITQEQTVRSDRKWRAFSFPLEVALYKQDGSETIVTVDIYQEQHRFAWAAEDGYVAVALNPRWTVPAEITTRQEHDATELVLRHAPSVFARLDAARALVGEQGGAAPAAVITTISRDPANFVLIDAIEQLSANSANLNAIQRLFSTLIFRNPKDRLTNEAITRTEAWLRAQNPAPATLVELERWRHRYLLADYAEQRRTLVGMMLAHDPDFAHRFAEQELSKVRWATRDRLALMTAMLTKPSASELPFIANILRDGSAYMRRSAFQKLAEDKDFGEAEIFRVAKDAALGARDHFVREAAINFLGSRENHRAEACELLQEIAATQQGQEQLSPANAAWLAEATLVSRTRLACADL